MVGQEVIKFMIDKKISGTRVYTFIACFELVFIPVIYFMIIAWSEKRSFMHWPSETWAFTLAGLPFVLFISVLVVLFTSIVLKFFFRI